MKKLITMTLLCVLFATRPALAGNTETNVGFGTGIVVGALAGGPPGAIIAAALGAHYGDSVHQAKQLPEANRALLAVETELDMQENDYAALNDRMRETRRELEALNTEVEALLRERAGVHELAFDLYYKTNSNEPDEAGKARLVQLGKLLLDITDLELRLEGHADSRGSETHNDELALARVENVRQLLVGNGVAPERIRIVNQGERGATAEQGDTDGQALDRRVAVRIELSPSALARSASVTPKVAHTD